MSDIFEIIEQVRKQSADGNETIQQMTYDVLKIATDRDLWLSTREIYLILRKAGKAYSRGAVNRSLQILRDDERAEFMGKENKGGIQNTAVPVYRTTDTDA